MFIPIKEILDPQHSWKGWLIVGCWIAGFIVVVWVINRLFPERRRKTDDRKEDQGRRSRGQS